MTKTIIQQGRFTSDGTSKTLDIRSDVDWIEVINETQIATTQTPGRGVKFEWYRGLAPGEGFEYKKADAANTLEGLKLATGGFTLIPAAAGPTITGTTITKASPPVCTAANHGFSNGDLVLFKNLTTMPQIALVGFSIGSVTTNTFELSFFNTNTANFTAETSFEVIKGSPFPWIGSWTNISSVITGTTTQVQFTEIDEEINYPVGTILRFNVPAAFGMVELDKLQGEVLSVNQTTNTFTIGIDSTGFTAFAWPASTAVPFSLPTVQSIGTVSNSSAAGVNNIDFLGIDLSAGINGPAGSSSDIIYWKAGKSFSVSNE